MTFDELVPWARSKACRPHQMGQDNPLCRNPEACAKDIEASELIQQLIDSRRET